MAGDCVESMPTEAINPPWGRCMSGVEIAFPVAYRDEPVLIGIHSGTYTAVNIIVNDARSSHQNVLSFLTDYTQTVVVQWVAIGQ